MGGSSRCRAIFTSPYANDRWASTFLRSFALQ